MASDFPVFKTVRGKYVYKRREKRHQQNLEWGAAGQKREFGYWVKNTVNWGISSNVQAQ